MGYMGLGLRFSILGGLSRLWSPFLWAPTLHMGPYYNRVQKGTIVVNLALKVIMDKKWNLKWKLGL